ncbi:wax ester/triacylglycerol synthase family O-acyltransferase [Hahella sp. KA22]|uniref:WS/DGAT/MGAT family O-acyltransferase n=1 Tax=Hahella sp. KA22 TaxID=1628392 RepID=UPI000FDE048B|nr:wax ester/triacylglycerol synthase family O-acyltransferase [Hahella sp. KA22]AZZ91109.1 wax ester/triacylglycerol synthase family O-acyltransferase [Hahella sp. KA22]QAY54478.1 wax ester/triacylglycerol synthase family O-acyltransferase [Hahella sp. KA22]
MTPLSPVDQIFLWLEKRQQPMHVGGLHIFSFPDDADAKYMTELAQQMRDYATPQPPFNRRLRQRWGRYYWDTDAQFDLEHHFRHEALPKPGRIRELLAHVSAEHSNLMDRERPMWECHLIEGIRGRRFAVYYKAHHCMLDGVAAMRMCVKSYSFDPSATEMPPIWAISKDARPARDAHAPTTGDLVHSLSQLVEGASKQIATVPTLVRELGKNLLKARDDSDAGLIFRAPQSILNQRITGSRRFAAQSYALERFKAIGKAFQATVNDVVLAVCGSALRNYLLSRQALPDQPLIAMAPMSIRQDDSDSGNQIAMILANLGTHIADPVRRLELTQASARESKERFRQMTPEEAVNYTALTLAPSGLNLLTGLAPKWQAFNVVISNVPGPDKPLYWNGARLEGMYPVSIPVDYAALNITLVSYRDQLEFGFTACRRTLPSMQRLLDYIEQGIAELEKAAGV